MKGKRKGRKRRERIKRGGGVEKDRVMEARKVKDKGIRREGRGQDS